MANAQQYCKSLFAYNRFKTREVKIGNVGIGGDNPIRVQSMTTTDTMDTEATVSQAIRMIDAGCEIVRITAPSKRDAENLANIKDQLRAKGYDTPLVADIHFTPNAAEIAARIVEKVRINPGNYADKKKFETIDYTDASYQEELDRIRAKFVPLVKICKEHGTAMRIGTNHGSLSDRIMSRYGDSPVGMVESAMEFLHICRDHDFHNIVLSMKSSNTQVVVQAYRLLVSRMLQEGMNYPLHLGVTEAGDGEDGRIKSAVGIGTLLADGLGDTIRVSLTEEPEEEIPVAKALIQPYEDKVDETTLEEGVDSTLTPFDYNRRKTIEVLNIGGKYVPVVVADLSSKETLAPASLFALGYQYSVPLDKWNITDTACDYIYLGDNVLTFETPGTLGLIYNYSTWMNHPEKGYPMLDAATYLSGVKVSDQLNVVTLSSAQLSVDLLEKVKSDNTVVLMLDLAENHGLSDQRRLLIDLMRYKCSAPVILGKSYQNITPEQLQLRAATDLGALLIDGLGDGVFISGSNGASDKFLNDTAFGILQATRTRISKTEYISCPSCGRTLFDLQETTAKIRAETAHLKGVKIGIMGCIVNGPGEMADADYGYVGTGVGKIALYKEKEVVQRNVPEQDAVKELIRLIKSHGDWVEKTQLQEKS